VSSEVAQLEADLEELAALRGQGTISLREWLAAKKPLGARLEAARARVPAVQMPTGVSAALGRKGGLRKAWPDLSDEARRRALAVVLEKIVIHPSEPVGPTFDTDRVELMPRS
jgi:site-specific DNA recombinase